MDRPRNEPRTADAPAPSDADQEPQGADQEPQDDADKPERRRHDQTYKGIFFHQAASRRLVRDFPTLRLHPVLDLATVKPIRTASIARDARRRLPDLAVRVWFKDREGSVVFLVEFQSSRDPSMALRTCDYLLGLIDAFLANPNMLDPGGAVPLVIPCVLYTGPQPWTVATSLAALTRTPEPPPAAVQAVEGLSTAHGYALLDLQSASAQDLLPEDSVLGWLGALEREPWKSFPRVHALMAAEWPGEAWLSLRTAFAEWTDARMRAADVPAEARQVVREQIIQPEEAAEMGQTYQEWADGHERRGLERGMERGVKQGLAQGREEGRALVVRHAARKFGAETAKRLEELVGAMGPEQLVRVSDAVMDCDTGDDLLAEAATVASVAS